MTYEIFSIICFYSFILIDVIFIRPYKSEEFNISSEGEKLNQENDENNEEITFKKYLKHWRFYTCFFLMTFRDTNYYLVSSSFTVIANHYNIVSAEKQKIISTISFISNSLLLLGVSLFIDKIRYQSIAIPSILLCLTHALTFQFVVEKEMIYIIYYFIINFLVINDSAATFPHVMEVFEIKYIVQIWGIFLFGTGFCGFGISQLYLSTIQVKPFNPIIGETSQVRIGTMRLYIEHTVNHPITSNFYGIEDNNLFKIYGFTIVDAVTGANNVLAQRLGKFFIEFNDGQKFLFRTPATLLQGTIIGERLWNYVHNMIIVEYTNKLCAYIQFNPDEVGYLENFNKK